MLVAYQGRGVTSFYLSLNVSIGRVRLCSHPLCTPDTAILQIDLFSPHFSFRNQTFPPKSIPFKEGIDSQPRGFAFSASFLLFKHTLFPSQGSLGSDGGSSTRPEPLGVEINDTLAASHEVRMGARRWSKHRSVLLATLPAPSCPRGFHCHQSAADPDRCDILSQP